MTYKSDAADLAKTLHWVAENRSCSGLLPDDVRRAADLLVEQDKELKQLRAALAAKDHVVTVTTEESKPHSKLVTARFVITDPRVYEGQQLVNDTEFLRYSDRRQLAIHVGRHLASVAIDGWRNDIVERAVLAVFQAFEQERFENAH